MLTHVSHVQIKEKIFHGFLMWRMRDMYVLYVCYIWKSQVRIWIKCDDLMFDSINRWRCHSFWISISLVLLLVLICFRVYHLKFCAIFFCFFHFVCLDSPLERIFDKIEGKKHTNTHTSFGIIQCVRCIRRNQCNLFVIFV